MSFRFVKNKPYGLSLAQQHRSAVGQARPSAVYVKIREARNSEASRSPEVNRELSAKAVRAVLDRVRRIGERVRENVRVAPGDQRLMMQEYEVLREQVVRIVARGHTVPLVDGYDLEAAVDLVANPLQIGRLVDAVFDGRVTPTDRIDGRGELLDLEGQVEIVGLEGDFELRDAVAYEARDAVQVLTDATGVVSRRTTRRFNETGEGPGWVEGALEAVRSDILLHAASSSQLHKVGGRLRDAALFFQAF